MVFAIDIFTILLFGLIWFCTVLFLRLKRKKRLVYLLFFTIFCIYLYKVFDYTLFQFQSLVLLKYFMPDLVLNGLSVEKSTNLIPLLTLTFEDLKTSLLNILLLVPFGFGLPFITNHRMKQVVGIGALFSIAIEFVQFMTGFMAGITFRVADINDVLFNTTGVAIGYLLFVGFVRMYRVRAIGTNPISQYILKRPQVDPL